VGFSSYFLALYEKKKNNNRVYWNVYRGRVFKAKKKEIEEENIRL